jgi:hypothetical protein
LQAAAQLLGCQALAAFALSQHILHACLPASELPLCYNPVFALAMMLILIFWLLAYPPARTPALAA